MRPRRRAGKRIGTWGDPIPAPTAVQCTIRPPCDGAGSMRLLHTSDWHLGHTLKDVTREHEHAEFLRWLLETCNREAPDVMVITGDVFDSATPPASAERMWFE